MVILLRKATGLLNRNKKEFTPSFFFICRKSMIVRRFAPFGLFLLFLSCLSGYLMSKPSLIGKVGIDLFYREYKFLRTWWQGALAVFITLMVFLFLQGLIQRKLSRNTANIIQVVMILMAL